MILFFVSPKFSWKRLEWGIVFDLDARLQVKDRVSCIWYSPNKPCSMGLDIFGVGVSYPKLGN